VPFFVVEYKGGTKPAAGEVIGSSSGPSLWRSLSGPHPKIAAARSSSAVGWLVLARPSRDYHIVIRALEVKR